MSSILDEIPEALRQDYEQLSQQAASLAMALARRRADVALLRAEAATVALSLESAKEELDDLLRKEKAIRFQAPSSPEVRHGRADFLPDQGLIRSLAGQLEVTKTSVRAALQRKASMEGEIDRLEKVFAEQGETSLGSVRPDVFRATDPAVIPAVKGTGGGAAFARDGIGSSSTGEHSRTVDDVARTDANLLSTTSLEQSILHTIREGVESKSSFRLDHAKIWRDVTMPNLALIRKDTDTVNDKQVSLGVITERIFEGVSCFTPTSAATKGKRSSSEDLRIDSSGPVRETNAEIASLVSKHFGAMTVTSRDESKLIRIVAPKVALSRVSDLVSDGDGNVLLRVRPAPAEEESTENQKTTAGRESHEQVENALPTRAPRRERTKPDGVHIKLSDASHVLHVEHFKQIMSQGVPARFHESGLELVYSTNIHGMSLHTLFNRVKKTSPTLLAIRDTRDRVFGCYAASPWKSSSARYYGTGESFVFGTGGPAIAKVYRWSRANSFFQFTANTFLAIGGGEGSHFALWIDEDLLMGTSSACSTFASPPLTSIDDEGAANCVEFKIVSLEVWGFNAHL